MSEAATAICDQQELLETLKAFKKGDFTVRMKMRGGGVAREIAGTLNGLIDLNQHLTKDLQRRDNVVGGNTKTKRELNQTPNHAQKNHTETKEPPTKKLA